VPEEKKESKILFLKHNFLFSPSYFEIENQSLVCCDFGNTGIIVQISDSLYFAVARHVHYITE
jgi:hypothetical protein